MRDGTCAIGMTDDISGFFTKYSYNRSLFTPSTGAWQMGLGISGYRSSGLGVVDEQEPAPRAGTENWAGLVWWKLREHLA